VDLSGVTITNGKYVLGSGGSGGAVDSVFGRTGDVVATLGDYTTALVPDSTNARYVTDAQLVVLGNTSGTNTGDQNLSGYATLTGIETLTNKTLTSPVINSDLFINSGGVINWNSGNATITHSAGLLTSNVPIQMPYIGVGGTPNSSTGLLVSGTGYTVDYPSGCILTVKWDLSIDSSRWSSPSQLYRMVNYPIVDPNNLTFTYPYDTIVARTKIRGKGRVLRMRFESETGKELNLIGWETVDASNTNY